LSSPLSASNSIRDIIISNFILVLNISLSNLIRWNRRIAQQINLFVYIIYILPILSAFKLIQVNSLSQTAFSQIIIPVLNISTLTKRGGQFGCNWHGSWSTLIIGCILLVVAVVGGFCWRWVEKNDAYRWTMDQVFVRW
jgi:cytochrome b561